MTKISIKETKPSSMLTKVNMTATKKSYRLYDSQYLFDCLMEFACLSDGTSINSFIRSKEKIAKSSFLRYFHKSGLADLRIVVRGLRMPMPGAATSLIMRSIL